MSSPADFLEKEIARVLEILELNCKRFKVDETEVPVELMEREARSGQEQPAQN
jgi:hypothetical protein